MPADPWAVIAYYCLHKFHWPPSYFWSLPHKDRAFIAAAVSIRSRHEAEALREMKAKTK
nr:MAG TPA: hypothetical protein [Caudoviricetes sp.]